MDWPARQAAVRELVGEYYLPLYRYAYRLTGAAADAEDLTQETFCKAQMRMHQLRDPERVKPWLFAILRNAYLRRCRDAAATRAVPLDSVGDVGEPPAAEPEIDPEELQRALSELPEAYRTPLILCYFESFSYRDIADQMGVPIGTVMSRLSRAKAHLRRRLAPPESETASPRAEVRHEM